MIDRKRVRELAGVRSENGSPGKPLSPEGRSETDSHHAKSRYKMKRIDITSAKLNVVFPEGKLPAIDPGNPSFALALGGVEIQARVNAKAARKLAAHPGGAVLQGRLVVEGGRLSLLDAGFSWIEARSTAVAQAEGQGAGES